jgi:hypothetical protein
MVRHVLALQLVAQIVLLFAGELAILRKTAASFVMCVRPNGTNWALTGQFFLIFL